MPPGKTDEAGGENDTDAGPGSAASPIQAEGGRHHHGDDGGNPAEEEAGNSQEDGTEVKNDAGRKCPGDQHDGDADDANRKSQKHLPENRLFFRPVTCRQIEKKGDDQQEGQVIDQIDEMAVNHCL